MVYNISDTKGSTRDRLLLSLRRSRDQWVSGEDLSVSLGVTRAAVSKHVGTLRRAGYEIEAVPRRGYRMRSGDSLRPDEIGESLGTEVFGRGELVSLMSAESTNSEARRLAERGAAEGAAVVAESQTAGRGRRGHLWHSPRGGLYASVVLRPDIGPDQASLLTLTAAVAAAEAVKEVAPDLPVRCKWPNDLLIRGRKFCGILTELSVEVDTVDYAVVGVGMNVHRLDASGCDAADSRETDGATSIAEEFGADVGRAELFRAWLERFEHWYLNAGAQGFSPVLERWKELSGLMGREMTARVGGAELTGAVEDVSESGELVLRLPDGTRLRLHSGDSVKDSSSVDC